MGMRILGIETSCDETALALLEASGPLAAPKFRTLKNIVSSQIAVHKPFGGVVPTLAKREHIKNLPKIFDNLRLKTNDLKLDAIAVTVGPGLEPALWAGIEFARALHAELKVKNPDLKLIGVNHLEGHLYSFLLPKKTGIPNSELRISNVFPAIALIVSGGHTILLKMDSMTKWKKLGETLDDAVGEAFDKVARMLSLPYPGGPEIQRLAEKGNPDVIPFPRPMLRHKSYNFSYSGLKTSVLYYLRDNSDVLRSRNSDSAKGGRRSPRVTKADVAASFQAAALEPLVAKAARAAMEFKARSIILSGGVAANRALRKKLQVESKKLKVNFLAPPMDFNTDNAVMIAAAGYMGHLRKKKRKLAANGGMGI